MDPHSSREHPQVGDAVIYTLNTGPNRGDPRPAFIVRVWPNDLCNLAVLTDHSNDDLPAILWATSAGRGAGHGEWKYPDVARPAGTGLHPVDSAQPPAALQQADSALGGTPPLGMQQPGSIAQVEPAGPPRSAALATAPPLQDSPVRQAQDGGAQPVVQGPERVSTMAEAAPLREPETAQAVPDAVLLVDLSTDPDLARVLASVTAAEAAAIIAAVRRITTGRSDATTAPPQLATPGWRSEP